MILAHLERFLVDGSSGLEAGRPVAAFVHVVTQLLSGFVSMES